MKLRSIVFSDPVSERKIALAVLTYKNKVLILQRSNDIYTQNPGKWGFPGGGVDEGETPKQAIFRECQEEIGIAPDTVKKVGAKGNLVYFTGELPCSPYMCLELNTREHTDWEMVDSETVDNFDTIAGMPEMIKKVLIDR